MAILYFTEVLSLNPGLSEAPINRSAPYIFTGDNKRAAEDIEKAVKADPRNAEAHYNLGIALENPAFRTTLPPYKKPRNSASFRRRQAQRERGALTSTRGDR